MILPLLKHGYSRNPHFKKDVKKIPCKTYRVAIRKATTGKKRHLGGIYTEHTKEKAECLITVHQYYRAQSN